MTKYILVTGGVISGVGKGIIASSIGLLLRTLGLNVTAIKIDPYLNVDAGTISPLDHGEVFVLDDGGEVDMDLGNYERFLDVTLTRDHNMTTGKIYGEVILKERRGDYLGKTVQVVPHLTDAIQAWIERVAKVSVSSRFQGSEPDVCIVELGGTVGDIESAPFIESMRQFQFRVGHENFALVHVSLVPVISSVGEPKTKPTQASVRELRGLGLSPDFIVCRSTHSLEKAIREKISMFCHVPPAQVISVHDCPSLYHVPLLLESQDLLKILSVRLNISPAPHSSFSENLFSDWVRLAKAVENSGPEVSVVLVGKYTNLSDSYISILKALEHASLYLNLKLKLGLVEAANLEPATATSDPSLYERSWSVLRSAGGIIVPGGFGDRGTDGLVLTCKYAREFKIPFFGICYGFQFASIEIARNVLKLDDANTTELDPDTRNPVVICMPEVSRTEMGGTMRLGSRVSKLVDFQILGRESIARKLYFGDDSNSIFIHERHRHRYEINTEYVDRLAEAGLNFVAQDELGQRMEILELDDHPYFVGCQYHPEFKSRPLKPSPFFVGLLRAASSDNRTSISPSHFDH